MTQIPKLERTVRGKRPEFLGGTGDDLALSMIMVLGQEVCALRNRLDVFQRIAADRQVVLEADVEGFTPDEAFLRQQAEWREAFLGRLFYLTHQMAAEARSGDSAERYQTVLQDIAAP